MHVAVDGGTWMNDRGYGRFTRELLSAAVAVPSDHRFTLVVDASVPANLTTAVPSVRVQLGIPPERAAQWASAWRVAASLATPVLPILTLTRLVREIVPKNRHLAKFACALPYLVLFATIAAVGEAVGYSVGPGRSADHVA